MKAIACVALHYGREFLADAVRSVQETVEEVHVFYSPQPSFGQTTPEPCPDSEESLRAAVEASSTSRPWFWHRGNWRNESAHRAEFLPRARRRGADVIVVLDADELWEPQALELAVRQAYDAPQATFRVELVHFWRSLHWVCRDPAMPVRLLTLNGAGEGYLALPHPVLHFGYAQSAQIVDYKQRIHGHRAEWRPGWFEQKFLPWRPDRPIADVHPTCTDDFWTPVAADGELTALVHRLLPDHPYLDLAWIP